LEHLLVGSADLGVFPTNRLLVRRAAGAPLIAVAAINHRPLEAIQTLATVGISRPRELEGRRVAYNPTIRGRAMLRFLVAADGGDPDAVIGVDVGARELTFEDIASGRVDATFGGYWSWEALMGDTATEKRVVWPVDEIGAPTYHSYLLGGREQLVDSEPDLIRAFLQVTAKGYLAARERPDLALSALEVVIPYFPEKLLARSLEMVGTTWFHQCQWGFQRPELMEPYADWLAGQHIIDDARSWIGAVTNDYLG
jgi:putative hydroxymethylpyrimidine transport system substrate-binding protein